jgi:hypothetical protein
MAYAMPVVTKEENVWVLRLSKPNGKTQEYRCSTENQARQLALVLSRPEQDARAQAQPA